MKWNRFAFSILMLACSVHVMANDSIAVAQPVDTTAVAQPVDTTAVTQPAPTVAVAEKRSKYDVSMERKYKAWASLIPTHFLIQNAGNMGTLSIGIGWSYGKRRQWETDLLFGFIPKHDSSRPKFTTTLKGNFMPWDIDLAFLSKKMKHNRWIFKPLSVSLYLNTVYGSEFWKSQPGRYPDDYYRFMSTKFRLNVAFGERLTFIIPEKSRKRHSRISLFYEFSTCDLYIRSMFQSKDVKLKDIVGFSLGVKFHTL